MLTCLAYSQDGSHIREEEANLSAVLAGGGCSGMFCDPLPLRIQARWEMEMLRGWVKIVVITRRADGKSVVPLLTSPAFRRRLRAFNCNSTLVIGQPRITPSMVSRYAGGEDEEKVPSQHIMHIIRPSRSPQISHIGMEM